MATLLSVKNRRCDARCHNAAGRRCACLCGGRLHGAGADVAARAVSVARLIEESGPAMWQVPFRDFVDKSMTGLTARPSRVD